MTYMAWMRAGTFIHACNNSCQLRKFGVWYVDVGCNEKIFMGGGIWCTMTSHYGVILVIYYHY
jgi:hypothetical protein